MGKPYQINGIWYYPAENFNYIESGIASWYGSGFHGRPTAHGEVYDMNELTAAHATLPLPSIVQVTNLENGRTLKLRVNDRGPFHPGRIIDVSRRAAQLLGFYEKGTAQVRVEILADESRQLAAKLGGSVRLASSEADAPEPKSGLAAVKSEPLPNVANNAASPPAVPVVTLSPSPAQSSPDIQPRQASQRRLSQAYVQAGAFADPENAQQVRNRLSALGPVEISALRLQGRDLYRVRLGPLPSASEAGRLVEAAILAGFPAARLIIE